MLRQASLCVRYPTSDVCTTLSTTTLRAPLQEVNLLEKFEDVNTYTYKTRIDMI